MKFLGVLTIAVLATTSGLPNPVYADGNLPPSPPVCNVAQARRTPVLFTLIAVIGTVGVVAPGFNSWEMCKSAGLTLQARFGKTDFVCVPMSK